MYFPSLFGYEYSVAERGRRVASGRKNTLGTLEPIYGVGERAGRYDLTLPTRIYTSQSIYCL